MMTLPTPGTLTPPLFFKHTGPLLELCCLPSLSQASLKYQGKEASLRRRYFSKNLKEPRKQMTDKEDEFSRQRA